MCIAFFIKQQYPNEICCGGDVTADCKDKKCF